MKDKKSIDKKIVLSELFSSPCAVDEKFVSSLVDETLFFFDDVVEKKSAVEIKDKVAIIRIIGPIMPYENFVSSILGWPVLEELTNEFKSLEKNPNIKTILFYIDSPGGQANGVYEFSELIKNSSKETITYINGMGCSAAYWIGTSSDSVYMDLTSEVGSIGVVAKVKKQNEENNFEFVSTYSPNKRLKPDTEAGQEDILKRIDAIAKTFIESIAKNRGVDFDFVVENFGKGGVLVGENALQVGMVDGILTYNNLIEREISKMEEQKEFEILTKEYETLKAEMESERQAFQAFKDEESLKKVGLIDLFETFFDAEQVKSLVSMHEEGLTVSQFVTMKTLFSEKRKPGVDKDKLLEGLKKTGSKNDYTLSEGETKEKTFMEIVKQNIDEGMTKETAISNAASDYPDLFDKYRGFTG